MAPRIYQMKEPQSLPLTYRVPSSARRAYREQAVISTIKKHSNESASKSEEEVAFPESTPVPVSSRETPIYLIYFGVSIWAALAGYGAHFYSSPHKTTSVHQGEAQPPASHMPSQTFSRPSKALAAWSQMLKF